MTNDEAVSLIQAMLASMRANPSQFHFDVNVTTVGAMGIGGPGGHGIVGIANGPGVGVYASASAPSAVQIQIAERSANDRLNAEFGTIQQALEGIIQELKNQSMTIAKRDGFLAQLKSTWLPNVLVTILGSILSAVLGG
jgi:hypothetical protein